MFVVALLEERALGSPSPLLTPVGDEVDEAAERWFQKGLSAVGQGRLQEAERCFEQVLRLEPDEAAALCNLGIILEQVGGKQKEAERAYRKAIKLLQGLPDAEGAHAATLNNLGLLLIRSNRVKEAEEIYRQALDVWPDSPAVLVNLAVLLAWKNRTTEAEPLLRRAIQLQPELAEAHHVFGRLLARQQRIPEALAEFEEAFKHRKQLGEKGRGLYRAWAATVLQEGVKAVVSRSLSDVGKWLNAFIDLQRRAERNRMLSAIRQVIAEVSEEYKMRASKRLQLALEDFLVGVKLMAIEDPWEAWDALGREISKVWPKGVSAVDAIREQRD